MSTNRTTYVLLILAGLFLAGCAESHLAVPAYMASRHDAELDQALADAVDLVAELRYDEAAPRLEGLVGVFDSMGDARRAGEALFWLGFCREKQDRIGEAREAYLRVLGDYPDTPAARQAEARLARIEP